MHSTSRAARPSTFRRDGRLYFLGELTLDGDRRLATFGQEVVPLSPAEFAVLHHLVSHRGTPLARAAIAEELRAAPVDPGMIDVYVNRIRRKLEASGLPPTVATVPGRGYAVFDDPGRFEDAPIADGLSDQLCTA